MVSKLTRMGGRLISFLVAGLVAYVIAVLFYTQINLSNLTDLGVDLRSIWGSNRYDFLSGRRNRLLHSLDFLFLIQHRPRWDLLVISLSIAGFLFSLTACLIGWRRLRPPPRRNRQRQTRRHEARP